MSRLLLAALAASAFVTGAHAQSSALGPFVTPSGALQFVRAGRAFSGTLDNETFDRFDAGWLTHFDDTDSKGDTVRRMLVQTDSGPVLYDFRRRPPVVQRVDGHMTVKRAFWQGENVVLQSPQGWFRFGGGVLTRLQSSRMTFH